MGSALECGLPMHELNHLKFCAPGPLFTWKDFDAKILWYSAFVDNLKYCHGIGSHKIEEAKHLS